MQMTLEIQKIDKKDAPWELLLLADPSRAQVAAYLEKGACYAARIAGRTVGVCVLLDNTPGRQEIMNLAIDPACQGQGVGKRFIAWIVKEARRQGVRALEVGTGNSSLAQLAFYQKAGFRISGVDRDFFTRHYPEAIFENGIRCLDMVRLDMDITECPATDA